MKRINHFSRLESKFTFMYTVILIIVISCIAIFIGHYSASILRKKALSSCIQKLDFVEERFNLILERIQNESLLLTLNQANRHERRKKGTSLYEEHLETVSFSSYLVEFLATQSAVESIGFYSGDDTLFYQDNYGEKPSVQLNISKEVRKDFLSSNKKSFWYIHESTNFSPNQNHTFSCLKKSYSFTGELLGFFALTVSPEQIKKVYEGFFNDGEIFLIADKTGLICAGTGEELIGQNVANLFPDLSFLDTSNTISLNHINYLCTTKSKNELTLIGLTPESYVYQDSHSLVFVIVTLGIISSIFTFFLFRFLTGKMMIPLNHIIAKVENMSNGDYHTRISISNTQDEIDTLARQINRMAENTEELLDRVHIENEQKRRYELSYIQLQIRPHFLYNTLETLCGMIEINDKKAAINLVNLISNFYRGTLNKGKEIITLEQEINITCNYLRIMQQRYPGSFHFTFHIKPELLDCYIPKLTLQPLVENAIIHGLNLFTTDELGMITISGSEKNSVICLTIADNGNGMTEETVRQLNDHIFTEEKSSFGIKSIVQRLKLYFDIADIHVSSKVKQGTSVTLLFSKHTTDTA